jgi:tellurite methyltransferase
MEPRAPANPAGSWADYFESMRPMPVHPLYELLKAHLPAQGAALELGAGVGQGARFLADHGLDVTAVDAEAEAIATLREQVPEATVEHCMIQDFHFEPARWNVICASFVLFFLSREDLAKVWPRLRSSLNPGGLFLGQFLGPHDDWAHPPYTTHQRHEVEAMLDGFNLLHFEEVERDGKIAQGQPKHWHVFHIIAKLPPMSLSST